jgi:hypothetical protein
VRRDGWLTCPRSACPHGGTTLAVEVDGLRNIARQLMDLPCTRLYQDGRDEKPFLFDLKDFDEVATIVRPKRRRRMT